MNKEIYNKDPEETCQELLDLIEQGLSIKDSIKAIGSTQYYYRTRFSEQQKLELQGMAAIHSSSGTDIFNPYLVMSVLAKKESH